MDSYSILGVKPTDSFSNIKKKYYKLCLKYHPDKAGHESSKKFIKIQEAFSNIKKIKEKSNINFENNIDISEILKTYFLSKLDYIQSILKNPIGIFMKDILMNNLEICMKYLFKKRLMNIEIIKLDVSYIDLINRASINFKYEGKNIKKELCYPFIYMKNEKLLFYLNIKDWNELDINWKSMNATIKPEFSERINIIHSNYKPNIPTIFGNISVNIS
jgi:hypothetical protein